MIKPSSAAIKKFFEARERLGRQRVIHEMGVRSPFQYLLAETARSHGWTFIAEETLPGKRIRPDGTLKDEYGIRRGYWEAKDEHDDLEHEIEAKIRKGYPLDNIIFEDSRNAVLYQDRGRVMTADLSKADDIAKLLTQFFSHVLPDIEDFKQAIEEFKKVVPELAANLAHIIAKSYDKNKAYKSAFDDFFHLCQTSLNPNIAKAAVEEMLVQHLLTERLIRTIFNNPEFTRRNVIAVEVEKVITALTEGSFSREEFLKSLDRFYGAIENAARTITDFAEKQHFLNTVYERFFQGYSVKVADTHGIVYTPQPIVDFMCASVEEVLKEEFGKTLGSKDVFIIDPCTGTGNFIVNLLNRIPPRDLPRVYREQLFANEIMLLPYYIAALNIEHAYYEKTGSYEPFEGLCFVDTLELAEGTQHQLDFMTAKNTERVNRQRRTPITVVIGNPPYNMTQANENDNNKNRKYQTIDKRVGDTYTHDSKATNRNKLGDPFVKFIRWASDRLEGRDGIVCFVSNSIYLEGVAFDGMRSHLHRDFKLSYVVDLKGNVRKDSMRDGVPIGEEHTVFGLSAMVGVAIGLFVKNHKRESHDLKYADVPFRFTRNQKFKFLEESGSVIQMKWQNLEPDSQNSWLVPEHAVQYEALASLASKEAKASKDVDAEVLFKEYTLGLTTARDSIVYDVNRIRLADRVERFVEKYNAEVLRYQHSNRKTDIDSFVRYGDIDWSRDLKADLQRGKYAEFADDRLRTAVYRPFFRQFLYFDRILNEEIRRWPSFSPREDGRRENVFLVAGGYGRKAFAILATNGITDLNFYGDPAQCFSFYVYNEDGSGRRENITDWALEQFRARY